MFAHSLTTTFVSMNNTTMNLKRKWSILLGVTMLVAASTLHAQLYPGDANHNGRVDHYDLLYIGYAYGSIGPIRPSGEVFFTEQALPLFWPSDFPDGVNYGFADGNGNGLVEWGDFLAVFLNYGNTTDTVVELSIPEGIAGIDLPIDLQTGGAVMQVTDGYELEIPIILGSQSQPVEDLNGLAFTLVYNDDYISSFTIDYSNAWPNSDGGMFYFQRSIPGAEHGLDAALTRFGPNGVSGYGEIARLRIVIEDDLIHLLPADRDSVEVIVEIKNIMLVNSNFDMIPVAGDQMTLMVYRPDAIIGITELSEGEYINLYPNPATDGLQLECELPMDEIVIYNSQGQSWQRFSPNGDTGMTLAVGDWPAGYYWVCVYTEKGLSRQKLMVIHLN